MAFNLADMVSKRASKSEDNGLSADTVYRDVYELVPSDENFYNVDPDRLQGLKSSILLFGVMQDVLIEEKDGKDRIISGHCRTMCCRMLVEEGHEEFRKINCKYARPAIKTENLPEGEEVEAILNKLAVIQANRFREKTDWEKMQEALVTEDAIKDLRNLVELKGSTRQMVRDTLGVSGTQLERYHAIRGKLMPDLAREFMRATINISVAYGLTELEEQYQREAVEILANSGTLTIPEVKTLKEKQEINKGIPGQITIYQTTGQTRPVGADTIIDVDIQIDRFFESLKKSTTERIQKRDRNMSIYMLSTIYNSVRIRNGIMNYQGTKEGIRFNPGSESEQLVKWQELADRLIEKYGKKQKSVKMVTIEEPEDKPGRQETKKLKKPDPEEKEYLDAAARHLIRSLWNWMREDHMNRVTMVDKSPEELKRKLGNDRTRWFATDKGTAHINMFDDYVQLWDEDSRYMGDYDWFYLAAAIQRMWNVVALEAAEKKRKRELEEQKEEPETEIAPAQTETTPEVVADAKDIKTENLSLDNLSLQINTDVWPGDLSDIPVPSELFIREYLEEEEKMLRDYLECDGLPERTILRQQLKVAGLRSLRNLVKDVLETEEETIQPELPRLKNNEERKEWLENYRDWGLWYRDERIDVNYYKYDFKDGSRLVAAEYPKREGYWNQEPRDEHFFHFLKKNKKKYASSNETYDEKFRNETDSITSLAEFLKEIQK